MMDSYEVVTLRGGEDLEVGLGGEGIDLSTIAPDFYK